MTNTLSAINTLKAKKNKKGFTLMEMLIVVAIIAILVAIAIPVFSTQLTKANQAVDDANVRSAESMAVADYYLSDDSDGATYVAISDNNNTMSVSSSATSGYYPGKAHSGHIAVVIAADGSVTSAGWVS